MKSRILNLALIIILTLFSSWSFSQQVEGDLMTVMNSYYPPENDDINCFTYINNSYDLVKQNSFLNDTVKVIYNYGGDPEIFVNTTGTPYWVAYTGFTVAFIDHISLSGNMGSAFFMPDAYKFISGEDTLFFQGFFDMVYVDDPCLFNNITGRVYIDNDGDCTYTSGDDAPYGLYPKSTVHYAGNTGNTGLGQAYPTDNTGNYSFYLPSYVPGQTINNYTISLPDYMTFAYAQDPNCNTISYNFSSLPQSDIDFVMQCEAGIDTYVGSPTQRRVRPDIPFDLSAMVANIGCNTVSGTLKLVLDPDVTLDLANSATPDNIVGDTVMWNYANLNNLQNTNLYYNLFNKWVRLTPNNNLNIGDILTFRLIADVDPSDVNPANNDRTFLFEIVNSYDPNIKEVLPEGEGEEGFIPDTTEELTYTVHFQNTGNAPALNVHIIDTLAIDVLDIHSFKIISSSHTMNPEWIGDGIIKFKFPNINLADSLSNEPESHGSVTYKIKLKPNLEPGTEIKNTAHIYFDSNPAIVTNTALNTIEFPDDNTQGLSVENTNHLTVYPNPTSGLTNFKLSKQTSGQLVLFDITGQRVITKDFTSNSLIQIGTENLAKGVYIYNLIDTSANTKIQGRLIVK